MLSLPKEKAAAGSRPQGQSSSGADYDERDRSTRYASPDRWKSTRHAALFRGNGPGWEKCPRGCALRQSLTSSSQVIFMKGATATKVPVYIPALPETYERR